MHTRPGTSQSGGIPSIHFVLMCCYTKGFGTKGRKREAKNQCFKQRKFARGNLERGPHILLYLPSGLLSKILELQIRLSRCNVSPKDWHHTRGTLRKTFAILCELQCPFLWRHDSQPSLFTLHQIRFWLQQYIAKMEADAKNSRIAWWKNKMKEAAKGDYAHIYHHLKNKVQNDPPNLLEDEVGNIISQPQDAIARMNVEWDNVFATNILRDQPIKVLKIIWPHQKRKPPNRFAAIDSCGPF